MNIKLPWLDEIVQGVTRCLPVVLTTREVKTLFDGLNGTTWLVASLLYGTGMRLLEGLRLRVKDLDLARRETIAREEKGSKDRVTMVPKNLVLQLRDQLAKTKPLHDADLAEGFGDSHPLRVCRAPRAHQEPADHVRERSCRQVILGRNG